MRVFFDCPSNNYDKVRTQNEQPGNNNLTAKSSLRRGSILVARGRGWIVNITSLGAKIGGINAAACYSASKAGLSCLTIQTAKETLAHGINVNGVAPGVIDTPLQDVYGAEKKEAAYKSVARGPGRPEDVAAAVLFLVSPGARYITGEILDVNGGAFMD